MSFIPGRGRESRRSRARRAAFRDCFVRTTMAIRSGSLPSSINRAKRSRSTAVLPVPGSPVRTRAPRRWSRTLDWSGSGSNVIDRMLAAGYDRRNGGAAVELLACLDWDGQLVLWWREGAGGERREHTGRVVGLVEVDRHDSIVVRWRRVQIAPAPVGLRAVRQVSEDDEQIGLPFLQEGIDAMRDAFVLEHQRSPGRSPPCRPRWAPEISVEDRMARNEPETATEGRGGSTRSR